jgi:hypothetical protein
VRPRPALKYRTSGSLHEESAIAKASTWRPSFEQTLKMQRTLRSSDTVIPRITQLALRLHSPFAIRMYKTYMQVDSAGDYMTDPAAQLAVAKRMRARVSLVLPNHTFLLPHSTDVAAAIDQAVTKTGDESGGIPCGRT